MSRADEIRRAALEERIRLAEQDLSDLAVQAADGELDPATAAGLESRYRADLEAAREELRGLPGPPRPGAGGRPAPTRTEPAPAGRSGRTVIWVAAAAMVALTLSIVAIASGDGAGETASAPTTAPSPDDAIAQMEAAVASQPGNNAMRLALAGIYFEAGDYMNAMNHYSTVTASDPTPEEAALADARIGWMAWVALDDPVTALQFLDAAIALDPALVRLMLRGHDVAIPLPAPP